MQIEDALARATTVGDRLRRENARLEAEIERLTNQLAISRQAQEAIEVTAEQQATQIKELRDLICHARELHMKPGSADLTIAGELVPMFAETIVEMFKANGGTNYVSWRVRDPETGEGYEMLLRKAGGKTQAEVAGELRGERDRFRAALEWISLQVCDRRPTDTETDESGPLIWTPCTETEMCITEYCLPCYAKTRLWEGLTMKTPKPLTAEETEEYGPRPCLSEDERKDAEELCERGHFEGWKKADCIAATAYLPPALSTIAALRAELAEAETYIKTGPPVDMFSELDSYRNWKREMGFTESDTLSDFRGGWQRAFMAFRLGWLARQEGK